MQSAEGSNIVHCCRESYSSDTQVRCDRDIPCGNCIDGSIECLRTTSVARNTQRAAKTPQIHGHIQSDSFKHHDISSLPARPDDPSQPPATQSCRPFKQGFTLARQVPADRLAAIKSAMKFANGRSQTLETYDIVAWRSAHVVDILAGIHTPPIEILYWMLCGKARPIIS